MKDPTGPDMILNRLREGMEAGSDSELARKLGISQQSISSARTKDRVPDSWVRVAAERFGLSADWLLFGVGNKFLLPGGARPGPACSDRRGSGDGTPGPQSGPFPASGGETVTVPMMATRLVTGDGGVTLLETGERPYAFHADFLRRKGQPSRMVLMRVDGDSMEPEIKDGDSVLIDRSQTAPRPGGIYAVSVEELIYLKIVDAEPGKLVLTSRNGAYAPIEVDTRGQGEPRVGFIGRVVWLGREYSS